MPWSKESKHTHLNSLAIVTNLLLMSIRPYFSELIITQEIFLHMVSPPTVFTYPFHHVKLQILLHYRRCTFSNCLFNLSGTFYLTGAASRSINLIININKFTTCTCTIDDHYCLIPHFLTMNLNWHLWCVLPKTDTFG